MQPEKKPTHLTSTSPPTCMRKEPSGCFSEYKYSSSFSLRNEREMAIVSVVSAGGGPSRLPSLLALSVPVDDVIGLLSANDAQCVDCCIRGCEVWVLARAPSKAAIWALTQLQELTHTRYTAKWKKQSQTAWIPKHHIPPESMPFQRSPLPPKGKNLSSHLVNAHWI